MLSFLVRSHCMLGSVIRHTIFGGKDVYTYVPGQPREVSNIVTRFIMARQNNGKLWWVEPRISLRYKVPRTHR